MANSARNDLIRAKNVLLKRSANTVDAAERTAINDAVSELDDAIDAIDQASLLQAAGIVAAAADALVRVVAAARMGPFDGFLSDISQSIGALQDQLDGMQGSERLLAATDSAGLLPMGAAVGQPLDGPTLGTATPGVPGVDIIASPKAVGTANGGVPVPLNSKDFSALRAEYEDFYNRCRLRPEFLANAEFYVSRLSKNKPVYEQLASTLNNMPWLFIGVVHGMESGFNFGTHLHNGDPLTARTVRVPAGRPIAGQPPFTWLESAQDALKLKRLHLVDDWSLPRMLYLLEAYNGFGYRSRGVPSPYLWSFSNLYKAGKFVADGVFDPNAVSKQCGAAVMMRVLQERGGV